MWGIYTLCENIHLDLKQFKGGKLQNWVLHHYGVVEPLMDTLGQAILFRLSLFRLFSTLSVVHQKMHPLFCVLYLLFHCTSQPSGCGTHILSCIPIHSLSRELSVLLKLGSSIAGPRDHQSRPFLPQTSSGQLQTESELSIPYTAHSQFVMLYSISYHLLLIP